MTFLVLPHSPFPFLSLSLALFLSVLKPVCFSRNTHTHRHKHTHTHTLRGRSRLCASLRLLATRVQKFTLFPEGYCAAADADSLFFLSFPAAFLSLSPSLFTLLILYTLSCTLTHAAWQEESGLKGGFGRI